LNVNADRMVDVCEVKGQRAMAWKEWDEMKRRKSEGSSQKVKPKRYKGDWEGAGSHEGRR